MRTVIKCLLVLVLIAGLVFAGMSEYRSIQNELSSARSQMERNSAQLINAENENSRISAELQSERSRVAKLEAELADALEQLSNPDTVNTGDEDMDALIEEAKSAVAELEAARTEIETLKTDAIGYAAREEALSAELDAVKAENTALKAAAADNSGETAFAAELEAEKAKTAALTAELEASKADSEKLLAALEAEKAAGAEAAAALEAEKANSAALAGEVGTLRAEVDSLKQAVNSNDADAALKAELTAEKTKNSVISDELKAERAARIEYYNELETVKTEKAKLEAELATAQAQIAVLSASAADVSAISAELEAQKVESSRISGELEAAKAENVKLRNELEVTKTDYAVLKGEYESARGELANANSDENDSRISRLEVTVAALTASLEQEQANSVMLRRICDFIHANNPEVYDSAVKAIEDSDTAIENGTTVVYEETKTTGLNLSGVSVGDEITFGCYEQDGIAENGTEPVEWVVLEVNDDSVIAISKYVLDAKQFNSDSYSGDWNRSTLRTWMNGEMFDTLFDAEEAANVMPYVRDGEVTDMVFLLSNFEIRQYMREESDRISVPTQYALSKGIQSIAGSCWWWLRTAGVNNMDRVRYVRFDGDIDMGKEGTDSHNLGGVRPVVKLAYVNAGNEADNTEAAPAGGMFWTRTGAEQ